ncbi:TPA: NAD(P)-binding domain-containing protein [Candidatus Micrarchaeota archaeon]|nr:NAD(P)-binding domain-containing protein [Candidatus Micrarchaeota archaeon]
MSNDKRLTATVVGANGNMGSIICIRLEKKPNRLVIYGVVNQNEDRVPSSVRNGKFRVTNDIKTALHDSKIVLFALHPENLQKCLMENRELLEGRVVLSSDSKYTVNQLENMSGTASGKFVPSPAIMTPFSIIPVCYSTNMTKLKIKLSERVLSSLGKVIRVAEKGLPGCLAHSMDIVLTYARIIELRKKDGLNPNVSDELTINNLKAAAYLSERFSWEEPIKYTVTPGSTAEEVIKKLKFGWQGEVVMREVKRKSH